MARTLESIEQKIAKLQAQAKALKQKEVSGVIARIKEAIRYYELSPSDLFGGAGAPASPTTKSRRRVKAEKIQRASGSSSRKPVAVKYRDQSGNTWTGRGNKPRWLVAELATGKKIEDFLVQSSRD